MRSLRRAYESRTRGSRASQRRRYMGMGGARRTSPNRIAEMSRSAIERRLKDVHERLTRARNELGVLNEQLAALSEDADDTHVRAVVDDSPMSKRENREAQRHVDAMTRSRGKVLASIAELERSQDELLDRLVVESK